MCYLDKSIQERFISFNDLKFFSSDRVHATNILGLLPISRSAFPYTLLLVTKIVFFFFFLHYQSDHFDLTPVINTHEILVDTSYTQLPFTKGRQDSCFSLVHEELPKAYIANNKLEKSIQTWFCSTMQSGKDLDCQTRNFLWGCWIQ